MFEIVFIGIVALIPLLLSEVGRRKARQQWQRQLKQILSHNSGIRRSPPSVTSVSLPSVIGDRNCVYNARSTYLRCTVNPTGPCQNCPHYEPRFKTLKKGE